jgi:hypothetical protein
MKKFFIILLMLFTVISIALAQPAMIDKGNVESLTQVDTLSTCQETRDDLYVEILTDPNCTEPGNYHFPNDSSLLCPLGWQCFKTNYDDGTYWHTWGTSAEIDNYGTYGPHSSFFFILLDTSCYIKVTVTDDDGNTGTDSIYFNIYNFTLPDDFEMEIVEVNNKLNAKISFTPRYDLFYFQAWTSQDNITHTPGVFPSNEGWIFSIGDQLYPNNYVEYTLHEYDYNENTTWNILTQIFDTCDVVNDVLPGMYLSTENSNDNHYLKFKTSIQSGDHDEYVYTIFTVDSNGIRYPFIINDEQVILPSNTVNYELPAPHEHPYYQCAVAGVTDNGDYKILSYSNKVANPWNSTVKVGEYEVFSFQVYPNPTKGMITVEACHGASLQGEMEYRITNVMGQTLMTGQITCRDAARHVSTTTIDVSGLPQGMYFISIGDTVRKIVVD